MYVEEGIYIINFIPEGEYVFDYWRLFGDIEFISSKDKFDNPNLIYINGSGSVRAYYKKGPKLEIFHISPANNSIFTDSPVKLEVYVTAEKEPVKDAEIIFYINSNSTGYAKTYINGYASFSFVPDENNIYTWYVTAKKTGFSTGFSDEWNFAFMKVRLDPSENETITKLPINLVAFIRFNGKPLENATVSYFFDNSHLGDRKTQANGYAAFQLRDITVGLHTWYVSVKIPGLYSIISDNQSLKYIPQLSVSLEAPKNDEAITDFTSTIELRALVTSDNEPTQGVNVSFFMKGMYIGYNMSDVDGIASLYFSPAKEDETYHWYAIASKKRFLNDTSQTWRFYYPVQPPYVEADEIFTSKSRADVNSEQTIGFHLRWENGSDVRGATILITDNHRGVTDDSGWVTFNVSSSDVDEKVWKIIDIECEGMGQFKHNFKYPKIIWDRISIELRIDNSRVDVGTRIEPEVKAFYEYDKSVFNGLIFYNTELYSDTVGYKKIKVKSIRDNLYGLSAFNSNELTVIWDRIKLSLEIRRSRVEVGSEANITVDGIYEYDQKPFGGYVAFNENLKQNITGQINFGVESISDPLYNLSVFTFNQVICIFDGIEIEQQINTAIPTQIQILTNPYYKYDHKPVEDARVKVNGVGEYIGSGKYKSTLYTFHPFIRLSTEIKLEDWETQVIEKNINALGNIILESGLVAILIIISVRETYLVFKRARAREDR